ncbi:hypothetical protein [Segniliparus rugosus]|uniref:Uncharacterized protein n=1 Tax=Segniliparus rugosus (strain ATCC BAA-974 / DSM 45345 / CCUG 50838 / CIP 108380 / JCM 13579 / CDC 945) TaxID=679197 RepID=E5XV42_SEGRC|nr:hypothetical protein [Segniliparus rugosus]EFV11747.1 hypothetical protein HMPREF9336_03364 [Segniliparus rugosus ATCC BAA-974]
MIEPIAPSPSDEAPWTVRLAYWYIGKRTSGAALARGYREPHLSSAAEHSFLYPPMAEDSLAAFAD